jgi:outer membrane lipoprotein-sorting protein
MVSHPIRSQQVVLSLSRPVLYAWNSQSPNHLCVLSTSHKVTKTTNQHVVIPCPPRPGPSSIPIYSRYLLLVLQRYSSKKKKKKKKKKMYWQEPKKKKKLLFLDMNFETSISTRTAYADPKVYASSNWRRPLKASSNHDNVCRLVCIHIAKYQIHKGCRPHLPRCRQV